MSSWSYTTKDGRLTVYEGATAFYVVDNLSGIEHCIGDGVGMFVTICGDLILVGTDEFYETFAEDLEVNWQDYLEAYFNE